jgi:hypothetical protein
LKLNNVTLNEHNTIAEEKVTEGATIIADYPDFDIYLRVDGKNNKVTVDPDDLVSTIRE